MLIRIPVNQPAIFPPGSTVTAPSVRKTWSQRTGHGLKPQIQTKFLEFLGAFFTSQPQVLKQRSPQKKQNLSNKTGVSSVFPKTWKNKRVPKNTFKKNDTLQSEQLPRQARFLKIPMFFFVESMVVSTNLKKDYCSQVGSWNPNFRGWKSKMFEIHIPVCCIDHLQKWSPIIQKEIQLWSQKQIMKTYIHTTSHTHPTCGFLFKARRVARDRAKWWESNGSHSRGPPTLGGEGLKVVVPRETGGKKQGASVDLCFFLKRSA